MSNFLVQKCALRRNTLPILPCDCALCDWSINSSTYNKCFWVLAHYMETQQSIKFSFEEISQMEGDTPEAILKIYESAINKIRQNPEDVMPEDENDN